MSINCFKKPEIIKDPDYTQKIVSSSQSNHPSRENIWKSIFEKPTSPVSFDPTKPDGINIDFEFPDSREDV